MKMLYTKSKKGGKTSPCHTYISDNNELANNFNNAFKEAKMMFLNILNEPYKDPNECIKFDDIDEVIIRKFMESLKTDTDKGQTGTPSKNPGFLSNLFGRKAPQQTQTNADQEGSNELRVNVKGGGRVLNFSGKKEITTEEKNILQEAICKLCLLGFKIINTKDVKECSNVIKEEDFYNFLTDNIESHTTLRNEGYIRDYISIVNKTKILLGNSGILQGNNCPQTNTQQIQLPIDNTQGIQTKANTQLVQSTHECKPCLCPKYMEKFQNLDEVEAKISTVLINNPKVIPKVIDNSCEANSNKLNLSDKEYITLNFIDDDGTIKPVCITFINNEGVVPEGGKSKNIISRGKRVLPPQRRYLYQNQRNHKVT